MGLTACKPTFVPLPTNLKLSIDQGPLLPDPERYRRLIGGLLYLNLSRPNVSYAIQHLSLFLTQPRTPHMEAAIHVVKYFKSTINKGLFYLSSPDLSLTAYSDADWGRCMSSRRYLIGYCVFLGDSLVSWKIKKKKKKNSKIFITFFFFLLFLFLLKKKKKKKKTVSKSSVEFEYRSMSETASELVWIAGLLQDLQIPASLLNPLHCDNRAAQHIAENPVFHNTTKHLDLDCHYVRDKLLMNLYFVQFLAPLTHFLPRLYIR